MNQYKKVNFDFSLKQASKNGHSVKKGKANPGLQLTIAMSQEVKKNCICYRNIIHDY